jgi:hypothetical protein
MEATLTTVPDEEARQSVRETFPELVARLSRLSVTKHYDAYADVPWDDPAYCIDPADPRWQAGDDHALGATQWYKSQPPEIRSRIGLHIVVCSMHTGVEFENILTRGLLGFAMKLPVGAPEFRYAYHEAIEESQHSLMFREFVTRAGLDPGTRGVLKRAGAARVIRLARRFPELFFLFVLGGEDPIDHVQRTLLRTEVPPILRRIMQIHVTELLCARILAQPRAQAGAHQAPHHGHSGASHPRHDGARNARSGGDHCPHVQDPPARSRRSVPRR